MKKTFTNYHQVTNIPTLKELKTQCTEYYCDALDYIPYDHPDLDEIVILLIDQVIDDSDYAYPCRD